MREFNIFNSFHSNFKTRLQNHLKELQKVAKKTPLYANLDMDTSSALTDF